MLLQCQAINLITVCIHTNPEAVRVLIALHQCWMSLLCADSVVPKTNFKVFTLISKIFNLKPQNQPTEYFARLSGWIFVAENPKTTSPKKGKDPCRSPYAQNITLYAILTFLKDVSKLIIAGGIVLPSRSLLATLLRWDGLSSLVVFKRPRSPVLSLLPCQQNCCRWY